MHTMHKNINTPSYDLVNKIVFVDKIYKFIYIEQFVFLCLVLTIENKATYGCQWFQKLGKGLV